MENKTEKNEHTIPGYFTCTKDKIDWYDGNKIKILYRCCSYYAINLNNGLRIYKEEITQIPLSSPIMIGPLTKIQNRQDL